MLVIATFSFSFMFSVFAAITFFTGSAALITGIICIALGIALGVIKWDKFQKIVVAMAGVAFGMLWSFCYESIFFAPAETLDGVTDTVNARIIDYPVTTDYGSYADVKILLPGVDVKARAYAYDDGLDEFRPGDEVQFTADFESADDIDGDRITNYVSQGIFLFASDVREVKYNGSSGTRFRYIHRTISKTIKETVYNIFESPYDDIICALLTGDKAGLYENDSIINSFTRCGIMHIFSVSGMHVSILAGFIASLHIGKRRSLVVTAVVLIIFMGICGFTASVVRATVMELFVIVAFFVRGSADSITSLSFAAFVLLLVNPYAVLGIGFQLSFASTAGIILLQPRFRDKLKDRLVKGKIVALDRLGGFIAASVSTTLGATIFTLPLSVYYFGMISFIAPASNLLLLWLVSPLFIMSILAVLIGLVYVPIGTVAAMMPTAVIKIICIGAKKFAEPFWTAVYVDNAVFAVLFVLFYVTVVVLLLLKRPLRSFCVPTCLMGTAISIALVVNAVLNVTEDGFTATVLNVGQGQCIVITSGDYTAVVDCGSISGEDAGNLAEHYIRSLGRDRVDFIILTHYHSDHANGVTGLISSLNVNAVVGPKPEGKGEDDEEENIIAFSQENGIDPIFVENDLKIYMGNSIITLYAPENNNTSENERGVTILVAHEDYELLITGDLNSESELELLRRADIPDIECLVVGHHGSKNSTSQTFLNAVTPEIAVISVGENSYGHPTQEVLDKLENMNITVFRTDIDGDVTVKSLSP